MSGRKGRVSNELVAASAAAVLTVYAAGYWRTRDEARRLETQALERRQARPAATPIPAPGPAPLPAEVPTAAVEALPAADEPPPPEAKPAKTPPVKVAAEKKAPAAAPPATPDAPALVYSVPLEEKPDPATTAPPPPGPLPEGFQGWRDGTYKGWGQSNHGDIEATVTIEGGRIVGSGIATCATRYSCDVIYTIIYQPVERQSPDVDRVSRATESADAYYYGLVEALKLAEPPPEAAAAPK